MKSILDPREVVRAQSGPRELKPPTSKDYAIQTLCHLKRVLEALHCDEREVERELDEINKYEHWKALGYTTRQAMFDAELGDLTPKARRKLEQIVLSKHGFGPGRGHKEKRDSNGNSLSGGNNIPYTLARLRRDRPELAEQVERGRLSANAAAIRAGFRVMTISVPLDPERAATIIRRRFTPEGCRHIAELLLQGALPFARQSGGRRR